MNKFKIGIFGSAVIHEQSVITTSGIVGKFLGTYKDRIVLVTGAADGFPYHVASTAARFGVEVWGFSAACDHTHQKELSPEQNYSLYTKLFFVPKTYAFANNIQVCRKYRNVTSTATCDAGIIISGRWGTLNEFTNLIDMGKVVGVLTGTGGMADALPKLVPMVKKDSGAEVIFSGDPKELVKRVIGIVSNRINN